MTATRQHENRAENRNENREEYRDDAPSTTLPVTYTRTLAPEQVESSALPDSALPESALGVSGEVFRPVLDRFERFCAMRSTVPKRRFVPIFRIWRASSAIWRAAVCGIWTALMRP